MAEIVIKLVNGELAGKTAQELQKNINACATAAKKAQIGTQEWMDANERLANAKALQQDYKDQLESTTKASEGLKSSFMGILDKIPGFSAITGAMQSAQGGVGGLTSGFGLLKGAIAATGIGLLIIAVSTLVMWFSKTEAGGNTLAGVMRAIGAVVNLLFGKVTEFGKAIFDAFSNPKQLLNDLVEFLENQVMNRFKAFGVAFGGVSKLIQGDFKGGLKDLADAAGMATLGVANITDKVSKIGKEFADAAVEGYNFVQTMDAIEDAQAEMEVQAKKNENAVNQLLLQAKNVGKSYEDRIALLDKADQLTRDSYQAQLKLSKQYLDAVNAEIDAEKKQQGVQDDTDEMRDKRKDAALKYLDLQGQEIELEEKIANRRDQILGKQEKADEKAAADLAKRLAEEEKARKDFYDEEDKIRDLHNQGREDSRDKDLDQVKLNLQKEIEALDTNSPLYADHLSAAQELARKQRADVNTKWDKTDADKAKKAADDQLKIDQQKNKLEAQLGQARLDTAKGVTDGLGDLLIQETKDQNTAKAIKKGIGVVDIGLNLAKELSFNAESAAANPLNAVTFGAAGAAQLTAMNLKSILFAAVNTAKVLAFRKGGYTGYGSSDDEPAGVVHRNEYVIPANITTNPNFSGIINTLEVARLNGFQTGGPVNPYADYSRPAIASGNVVPTSSGQQIDYDKLGAVLHTHAMNVVAKIKVINRLQDVKKGLDTIKAIQEGSDF